MEEQLRTVLHAVRHHRAPAEETLMHWAAAVEQLEQGWEQYIQEAFQYLVEDERLTEPQRQAWHKTVQQLELEWRQSVLPALNVANGQELSALQTETLAVVQETLDRLALTSVRDNSVLRSVERHVWFRLLEKLDRTSLKELEESSRGRVGFLQLFDQPEEYRGELVTVRGMAHLGYRVRAPKNFYGIDHYYVFWLAPAGGPNSPLCVYCLETPSGFPALKDKDLDRETTPLNMEMEFTGYFFKRWAYRAHDGLRIAPLVLAKTPRWTPPAPSLAESRPATPLNVAMYLLGAAAVGVTVALLAYWQGRWQSAKKRAYQKSARRLTRKLKSLENNDPAEDLRETLRRLSEEPKA
jgi:hypothetical protein